MKFDKTWTGNWENAFRGLRHPLESYAKSDSDFGIAENEIWLEECANEVIYSYNEDPEDMSAEREELYNKGILYWGKNSAEYAFIGKNDMDLAQRMIKAGAPNDKFLRQIFVSVDITAPLYWWKEMDTYKVATVANSTSTMHKLAATPITIDCFETDDLADGDLTIGNYNCLKFMYNQIIDDCELLRQKHLEFVNKAKNASSEEEKETFQKQAKIYWKELIRWLPESWLQTRTWTANYSTLRNIIHWREGHRLSEWHQFIEWCHTLPYSSELLFYEQKSS